MRYLLTPARTAAYVAAGVIAACTGGVAYAQDDTPPVSAVQLCAATDIDQIDALLTRVADTELVRDLAPLASLTVPRDPDGVVLAGNVDLDQVRTALNCQPSTGEPEPTATPAPTTDVTAPATPDDDPDITTPPPTSVPDGFEQLDQVPTGAAQTGGGPA